MSNDNGGNVSFAVTFTNRTSLGSNEIVSLDMDTDANASTGYPPVGLDYSIQDWGGETLLWRFEPSKGDFVMSSMATLRTDWSGPTLTFHVNTSELGKTGSINFGLWTTPDADSWSAPIDQAPDWGHGLWTYTVKLAPSLKVTALDCKPEPGVRGKPLVGHAFVSVTRAGNAEALPADATVAWTATYAGRKLRLVGSSVTPVSGAALSGASLQARWKLPKTGTAKVVKVTLKVTADGVTITKLHLHRVK